MTLIEPTAGGEMYEIKWYSYDIFLYNIGSRIAGRNSYQDFCQLEYRRKNEISLVDDWTF